MADALVFAKGAARFTSHGVGINVIAKIRTVYERFVAGRRPSGSGFIASHPPTVSGMPMNRPGGDNSNGLRLPIVRRPQMLARTAAKITARGHAAKEFLIIFVTVPDAMNRRQPHHERPPATAVAIAVARYDAYSTVNASG